MRVLLTGASGRIGGHLVKTLSEAGWLVRGFDLVPAQHEHHPQEMVTGSLLDPDIVEHALDNVDAVIHLAALMSWNPQDDQKLFAVNVQGTFNLLQAARSHRLSRFIFASSGEVYPELNPVYQPIDEDHPTQPNSTYGLTKLLGEEMVKTEGRRGLPYTILRFSHTQSPEELLDTSSFFSGPRFYVNAKLRALSNLPDSESVRLSIAALEGVATAQEQHYIGCGPDGRPYRMGICDVRDMAHGLLLALSDDKAIGETFNIGPAASFNFDEAVPYLAAVTGLSVTPVKLHTASYHYDTSIDKARRMLGYEPSYSITRMIDDAAAGAV